MDETVAVIAAVGSFGVAVATGSWDVAGRLLTLFRPRLQRIAPLPASTNLIIHKSVKIVVIFAHRK